LSLPEAAGDPLWDGTYTCRVSRRAYPSYPQAPDSVGFRWRQDVKRRMGPFSAKSKLDAWTALDLE